MAQDPYAAISSAVPARRPAPAPTPAARPMVRIGGPAAPTAGKTGTATFAYGESPANDALLRRYAGMTSDQATQIYQNARAALARGHTDPAERQRALTAFDTDPRTRAIRQVAGLAPLTTRAQDIRDVRAQTAPLQRSNRIDQAGRQAARDREAAGDFPTAVGAGIRRAMLGIPERLAAAGERWLPSALTGNDTDLSYDELLQATRAGTDEELNRSTPGNIIGQVIGSVATGRAIGGALGYGGNLLRTAAAPAAQRAGNVLQALTTMQRGQRLANTGRIVLGGATGGAAQAVGQGTDPVEGAVTGAIAAPVLGLGFKAAQVVTRPFRDFLRLSSAGRILNRLTSATQDQLETRAAEYRTATGAEPTVFELLPLADRNRILRQTVVGRDNVVEQASNAIRARANNLGPEMSNRARTILQPQRDFIAGGVERDLTAARGGNAAPEDPALVARATTSPTDMSELRDTEARAIMAPHENTPVVANLEDLYPQAPGPRGGAPVSLDPEVATVIRSAAGTLRQRPDNAGVTAGDITDMISTLRGDLGRGGIEGRTAERAINHLQNTLDANAPEAGAAARQMSDAYAARSRMAEGMQEGAATRLRDEVQVGTNRRDARRVRNAYDTPEGAAGRSLGQGNRVLSDLAGSPEEALRATVRMSRNSTGRQLAQNVGPTEAEQIMAAARAQDASAQALSSASQTAQSGGGEASNAEALVQSLVGLHPSSFITTKIGAVRRLIDMTYIPEGRARTMVNMLFSQDPALARRALTAIGNEPNGAQFMRYLSGIAGTLSAGGGTSAHNEVPQPEEEPAPAAVAPEAAPEGDQAAPDEYDAIGTEDTGEGPGVEGTPVAVGDSPYAGQLQEIYNTESPEMLDLISRVMHQESGGNQHDAHGRTVVSPAGAVGIMQVMPATGRAAAARAGVPWDPQAFHHDPAYNKLLGITELAHQLRRYNGDVRLALIAYNAGPGRADRVAAGHEHIPAETQNYVASIM